MRRAQRRRVSRLNSRGRYRPRLKESPVATAVSDLRATLEARDRSEAQQAETEEQRQLDEMTARWRQRDAAVRAVLAADAAEAERQRQAAEAAERARIAAEVERKKAEEAAAAAAKAAAEAAEKQKQMDAAAAAEKKAAEEAAKKAAADEEGA